MQKKNVKMEIKGFLVSFLLFDKGFYDIMRKNWRMILWKCMN